MGEVYRARDTRLDRTVALKVLPVDFFEDEGRKSRFEREAKLLAALSHPNIAVVYAFEEISGSSGSFRRHLLAMELLEGETLREKLGAPLPPRKAVEYAIQIAHGLAAAHQKGIIHRDIKPENVFVTKDGHVKILDFGVAKLLPSVAGSGVDTETPTATATQPGTAVGTVAYMSPEQIRGQPVDARTDLFSLGVVLYEMLSGKRPFQRDTFAEIMTAILREEPQDLSSTTRAIPAVLEKIVRHCLEKDPSVRMQSARELIFALETLSGLSGEAPARPGPPWSSRLLGRTSAFAGGAVLVAALVVGALWCRSRDARPAAGGTPSVLALPCKVHGAPEAEYLTDAVPGTISTLLASVAGLETKVPPSSFEVEKLKGDLSKIAEAFRVENLLLTTLTAQGDRLVLNAQLVDAWTRRVKWGKQYQGPLRDFNDLARQAAEGVRHALSPAASPVPTSPVSSEVELAFQEGKHFRNRYFVGHKTADFELALRSFTRALELDRSSARVPAEIARLCFHRFRFSDEEKWLGETDSWARKALELDPESGVAWAARTWILNYTGEDSDMEKVIGYGLKAVRNAPRDGWANMSLSPTVANPGSELLALAVAQHAREVDPLLLQGAYGKSFRLLRLARPLEALETIDQGLRLEPTWRSGLFNRAWALVRLGRPGEAADALQQSEPLPTDAGLYELWRQTRLTLALVENDAAAVKTLEAPLFDLLAGERSGICVKCNVSEAVYRVAPALARAGRKDDALKIILRSVQLGIAPSYDFLLLEPDVQTLRSDPRFAKVLDASRDGAVKVKRILERARARGDLPTYLEEPFAAFLKLLNESGTKS